MRLYGLRKGLVYAMMTIAFLTLHLSRELSPLVPPLYYLGALVSWFWDEPRVNHARQARFWTVATLAVFAFTLLDVFVIGEFFLISAMNFVLFLATAKLFQRAEHKDYTQAMALSLLLLAAGSVLNENLSFGLLFAAYTMVATVALVTQHLQVEVTEHHGKRGRNLRMERPVLVATVLLAMLVFAGSAAFFFAFPRVGIGAFVQQNRQGVTSSGFGDDVQLGEHGTIREDATIVMRVVFMEPPGEMVQNVHWRGLSLDYYDGRSWHDRDDERVDVTAFAEGEGFSVVRSSMFAEWDEIVAGTLPVEVNLEPMDSDVVFAPGRLVALSLPNTVSEIPASAFGRAIEADQSGEVRLRTRGSLGVRYIGWWAPQPTSDSPLGDGAWATGHADLREALTTAIAEARSLELEGDAEPDEPIDEGDDSAVDDLDEGTPPPPRSPDRAASTADLTDGSGRGADAPVDAIDGSGDAAPDATDGSGDAAPDATDDAVPDATDGSGDAAPQPEPEPAFTAADVEWPLSSEDVARAVAHLDFGNNRARRWLQHMATHYLQLPRGAITPRMAEWTAALRAEHPDAADFAVALERTLSTQLTYTTDLPQPSSASANLVDEFLFEWQRGHCEYFATTMVVLLREQGIPARIVNGFLGADYNEVGDYWNVRQANAHSWVEAFLPDVGWVRFDPTPAGSVDIGPAGRFRRLALWIDSMRLKWFRWVVEYDLEKQFTVVRDALRNLTGDDDTSRNTEMQIAEKLRNIVWWLFRNSRALASQLFLFGFSVWFYRRRALARIPWSGADTAWAAGWAVLAIAAFNAWWDGGLDALALALALGPVVVVSVGAWLIRRDLMAPDTAVSRSRSAGTVRVSLLYARLLRDIEREDDSFPLSITVGELRAWLQGLPTDIVSALEPFLALYERARFGGIDDDEEAVGEAARDLRRLRRPLRRAIRDRVRERDRATVLDDDDDTQASVTAEG